MICFIFYTGMIIAFVLLFATPNRDGERETTNAAEIRAFIVPQSKHTRRCIGAPPIRGRNAQDIEKGTD